MIAALIEAIVRCRWLIGVAARGGRRRQHLRNAHRAARRDPRYLRPAGHRLREVAAQPGAARDRSHRAHRSKRCIGSPDDSLDPRDVAHGLLVHLRDPAEREPQRAAVRQLVADRLNAIRPQLPPDATVTRRPERERHRLDLRVRADRSRAAARPARAAAAERESDQARAADACPASPRSRPSAASRSNTSSSCSRRCSRTRASR